MKFPYPKNPADWQAAYTSDLLYRDSRSLKFRLLIPLFFCFLVIFLYVLSHLPPILFPHPIFKTNSPFTAGALTLLTEVVVFLLCFHIFRTLLIAPALRVTSNFVREFYRPPENINPDKIIKRRLLGKSNLPPPLNLFAQLEYIIVKDGELDKKDEWPAWSACNLGGPILLVVFDGCALYLDRGNCFSRVVGPGKIVPYLEWYETIKYVVDLRPKVKTDKFDVWTKDGIKIVLTVQIECRIGDPSMNDPANGLVYPYDPDAVKRAVERLSLRWPKREEEGPSEFTWVDAAWGQVTGIVPGYIGGRTLDDLFMADRNSGQILSPNAMMEIFEKLNKATNVFGVFVTDFQILKEEIPDEVLEHQKEYWKAAKQGITTRKAGEAKAFDIRAHEKIRADAQGELIMAIADGLEKNKDSQFAESLLLLFSSVLDESTTTDVDRAYFVREALEALEQLQRLLEHPSNLAEENNDDRRHKPTS